MPSALHVRFADRDELVGISVGKGTKQQRADAAEDRGVHTDAEREADDGGKREARVLEEGAGGVADVLKRELSYDRGLLCDSLSGR